MERGCVTQPLVHLPWLRVTVPRITFTGLNDDTTWSVWEPVPNVSSQTNLHHWPRSRGQCRIQGMARGRPSKGSAQQAQGCRAMKAHLPPKAKDKEQISRGQREWGCAVRADDSIAPFLVPALARITTMFYISCRILS